MPCLGSRKTTQDPHSFSNINDGHILFSPMYTGMTYLIDSSGSVTHIWSSSYWPGVAVWWLGDGMILRSIRVGPGPGTGGAGGGIQKVTWEGDVVWDFRYNTDGYLSHHDIKTLPNGNVLMIAWETKTRTEAIAAGRNPTLLSNDGLWPSHIIEVQPTGPTSGEIVWEWHVWDHLIQEYDSSKANYGTVQDHPELADINYGIDEMSLIDWMHTNSIDYNEQFDQIMISVHNFNEIWVIDHSTTTQEAAGHTGGNSGKGGDLLYRWGNPQAYQAGTSHNKKLFGQHDATWIDPGFPGAGNILVFNNGVQRPGGWYSSVDEITPPVDAFGNYYLEPGSSYGPQQQTWIYTANPPGSFIAGILSGATRLKNGNTLICDGVEGRFFEVTPDGTTVWEYINPYPTPNVNDVFKIVYIPPADPPGPGAPDLHCSGDLSWENIKPGTTVMGSFQVCNIGNSTSFLQWKVNTSSISWGTWSFSPESGEYLRPEDGPVTVIVSMTAPDETNAQFEGYIRVENQQDAADFELIPVMLSTATVTQTTHRPLLQAFFSFFSHHSLLFQGYSFYHSMTRP